MEPLGRKYNSMENVVKIFMILMTVLWFLGYPIALFIPIGHGYNIFDFFFPAFLMSSALSACLLITAVKGEEGFSFVEKALGILFMALLIATLINGAPGAEFLKYTGIILIPLAVGLCYKVNSEFTLTTIKFGSVFLWLINVIHCYHRLPIVDKVGICGNQNWLSAVVLAAIPLVILTVKALLKKWVDNEKAVWAVSAILVIALSIPVILKADSRASFVAIILLPLYLSFLIFGQKVKVAIITFAAVAAILGPSLFKEQVIRENKRNVRLPMWRSTVNMIVSNPLGVGPENFEYRFPEYVSRDQKAMLVSAETTLHPHNEFLHMSAMGGVAAGIIWILIVGLALFGKINSKEELFYRIPLFVLFIQGMMDKPLYQMPTMLWFYVLLGLTLGRRGAFNLNIKKPVKEKVNFYKGVAAVVLVVFAFFAFKLTSSSWLERKALIAQQQGDKEKALTLFTNSFESAPWRLFPAYKAFILTTVDKPDVHKAIDFYSAIEESAPDYRQFNLLKGQFLTQLAGEDREKAAEHLQGAWYSYNRACQLNSTNVLSFLDRLKFACRFLPKEEIEKSYSELVDVYKYKTQAGAEEIKKEIKEWGAEWLKNQKYSEFLTASNSFMGMLKPAYTVSTFYPLEFSNLFQTFSGGYSIADMVYATDSMKLMNSLPRESFDKKVQFINKEIRVDEDAAFTWPLETLKLKKGSRLSKMCLMAMTARIHGYDPLIHLETNSVFLKKGRDFYLIDGTGFRQMTNNMIIVYPKGKSFIYFDYPQGFFHKNEFLAYVLDEAGAVSQYCRNPDYVINSFNKYFEKGTFTISICKEPFSDILSRIQGGRK